MISSLIERCPALCPNWRGNGAHIFDHGDGVAAEDQVLDLRSLGEILAGAAYFRDSNHFTAVRSVADFMRALRST
jgi:hypothetical protein